MSCSIVFLFFETLGCACASDVVSLELLEEMEDFVVGEKGSSGVQNLTLH